MRGKTVRKLSAWLFGAALIALWEIAAVSVDRVYLLPGPADVIRSLLLNRKEIFLVHLPATMEVVAVGGALSILVGALFAVMMDLFGPVRKALYPLLTLSQAIPVMCLAPVFVLWFGYTTAMRVVVVILTNFFPVTINLYDGLRSARPERMELMKTWGATNGQIFRLLRFPSSLPYLFTALRIAVPWSVIAAAVAEWLGAPAGLGFYSRYCMMDMDAPGLLAPLLVLTVIALLLNGILKVLERRIVSWRGQ